MAFTIKISPKSGNLLKKVRNLYYSSKLIKVANSI
jgi:hypothetical protein